MTDLSQAKQIEGFSNYWIFPDGSLYSTFVKKQKKANNRRSGSAPVPISCPVVDLKRAEGNFKNPSPKRCPDKQYMSCILTGDLGEKKNFMIHTLVAHYFIGPRPMIDGKPANIDHINRNSLDNHVSNLRYGTQAQNIRNSIRILNSKGEKTRSEFKCVTVGKKRKVQCGPNKGKLMMRYYASVTNKQGKKIHLGTFDYEIEAAKAADKYTFELYGEFAYLNFPDDYR